MAAHCAADGLEEGGERLHVHLHARRAHPMKSNKEMLAWLETVLNCVI